jgi:alpha-galactosidase
MEVLSPGLLFNGNKGTVELNFPSFRAEGVLSVIMDKEIFSADESEWLLSEGGWEARSSRIAVTILNTSNGIRIEARNESQRAYKLQVIDLSFSSDSFDLPLDARNHVQYAHSLIPCYGDGVFKPNREPLTQNNTQSYGITVYNNRSNGDSLLLGAMGLSSCTTSFENLYAEPHRDSGFGIKIKCDFSCMLNPGKSIATPEILAFGGNDPLELLVQYGERWKQAIAKPAKPRISGWNSWDYYAGSVREQDVDENLEALAKNYSGAKYVVIDDGWQERWGEWEINRRFPSGLAGLAGKIKAKGFIPGLWAALSAHVRRQR